MFQQTVTIFVLAALTVQTVVGGFDGTPVLVCLGHGHDQIAASAEPSSCSDGCSHSKAWPVAPQDDKHEGCDCTDLELASVHLSKVPRNQTLPPMTSRLIVPVPGLKTDRHELPGWSGRTAHPPWGDPGGGGSAGRLALVRSTRLLM